MKGIKVCGECGYYDLKKHRCRKGFNKESNPFFDDCDLPDVEYAITHGKWMRLDMHRGMQQYKCSACEGLCYVPECMGEPMYSYCPNCGARMDE